MKTINKQGGMTAIGLVFVLLLIGFFTLITLKVGPMYLQNFSVVTSLESLKNEPEIASKSVNEILQLLLKRLDINDVDNVTAKDIAITRTSTGIAVNAKYETRKDLFGNIAVVGKFDERVELNQR
jgi:hypothetical protein